MNTIFPSGRKRLFRVLFPAFVLLLAGPVFACDFCGAYLGVTPFDNQSSIGLSHRYRVFNGYASLGQGSSFFPAGAYRLPAGAPSPLHGTSTGTCCMSRSDFESYKIAELRGRWFIHPRMELNILLPFIDNKSEMAGMSNRATGMGDCSFFAAYHLINRTAGEKRKMRLIVGAGLKLPTGKTSFTYEDGDRLPVMLQAGTGSTDGFAFVQYTMAQGNWRWGISTLGKMNGTNVYGEQICPSTVNSGFVAWQFSKCGWVALPQLQVYEEYTKGVRDGIGLMEGTGMNMVLGGPGLEIYRGRFGFSLGAQLPLFQQTDEMNMKTAGRLLAGISWSFRQEKYLLN